MAITVQAVYENGVLKPAEPLPLREHEKVRVTIETTPSLTGRSDGMVGWNGGHETLERLVAEVQAPDGMPLKEPERGMAGVNTPRNWVKETAGMIKWSGDHESLRHLAEDVDLDPQEDA